MKVEISIIIPVYNVEKYLERCIRSVLNQSFTEFEVILVNDGSTDNSYKVCEYFKNMDQRIKLLNQDNCGVSIARNKGLSIAEGKWITFVDSDDYLEKDYLKHFYESTRITKAALIVGDVCEVDQKLVKKDYICTKIKPKQAMDLTVDKALKAFLDPYNRFIIWAPWGKLIRADIAKAFVFEPGRKLGEDFFYCFQCILQSNQVCYIPFKEYNYYKRDNSAVRQKKITISSFDNVYFSRKVIEILKKSNFSQAIVRVAENNMFLISARTIRFFYRAKERTEDYEICCEMKNELHGFLKKYFWRGLKGIQFKHKLLLIQATFCPITFLIR